MEVSRRVSWMVVAALAVSVGACAGSPAGSDLPRTTDQGITITVSITEEVMPLTGCRTHWLTSNDEEPPPGACEQSMTVHRFIGQHEGESVETSVVGEPNVDPLYGIGLAARNLTETVSLVVVDSPSNAVTIRLTDDSGVVVDEVDLSGGLAALAGLGSDLTVEAVAADGTVVAACPPEGVVIEGIGFECTLAADATIPVTTIPTEAPNP